MATVFRRKQNGNMRAEPGVKAIVTESLMTSLGMKGILGAPCMRQAKRGPMRGGFTICSEMCGSGAGIYTIRTYTAHTEYSAAEAGRKRPGAAGRHAAGEATRRFGLRISGFVWPDPFYDKADPLWIGFFAFDNCVPHGLLIGIDPNRTGSLPHEPLPLMLGNLTYDTSCFYV